MSDNDLIRRGDAKKTASGYIDNCDYMLDAINAIPAVQPTVKPDVEELPPCPVCGSHVATRGEAMLPDGQWVCSTPCERAALARVKGVM